MTSREGLLSGRKSFFTVKMNCLMPLKVTVIPDHTYFAVNYHNVTDEIRMHTARAVLPVSLLVSLSPTDTELSSSWKQRPLARDIPPSVAPCLSLSSVVSLQSAPPPPSLPFPPHHHQPTLLTTRQGTTLITYLMTGASLSRSLSLSESLPFFPPSLSSCCLVTNEPGLVNNVK